jgi:hypothetical protein
LGNNLIINLFFIRYHMFLSSLAKTSVDLGMADTAADFAQALG